jgi:hypothetical protein
MAGIFHQIWNFYMYNEIIENVSMYIVSAYANCTSRVDVGHNLIRHIASQLKVKHDKY